MRNNNLANQFFTPAFADHRTLGKLRYVPEPKANVIPQDKTTEGFVVRSNPCQTQYQAALAQANALARSNPQLSTSVYNSMLAQAELEFRRCQEASAKARVQEKYRGLGANGKGAPILDAARRKLDYGINVPIQGTKGEVYYTGNLQDGPGSYSYMTLSPEAQKIAEGPVTQGTRVDERGTNYAEHVCRQLAFWAEAEIRNIIAKSRGVPQHKINARIAAIRKRESDLCARAMRGENVHVPLTDGPSSSVHYLGNDGTDRRGLGALATPAGWTDGMWAQLNADMQNRFQYATADQQMAVRSAVTDGNMDLVYRVLSNVQVPGSSPSPGDSVEPGMNDLGAPPTGWTFPMWDQLTTEQKRTFYTLDANQQERMRKTALSKTGIAEMAENVADLNTLHSQLQTLEQRVNENAALTHQNEQRIATIEGAAAQLRQQATAGSSGVGTLALLGALGAGAYFLFK